MPETKVPFLDAGREAAAIGDELTAAIARVVAGGRYVLGPEVEAFEDELAAYCGRSHCVGVGNGLDAIRLVLIALGIGPGDEVLVPAYTAVATWMAVSLVGATPVGVDVVPHTYNMDPQLLAAAIGPRTKAIVAVALFGQRADMEAIAAVAREHGVPVVEDAAQAIGARARGQAIGSDAIAATLSFYPTKNLGAIGDGGAIVTDDGQLADRVRLQRAYGWRERGLSEVIGGNTRLDELQAAILRVKLRSLDAWNERRRAVARRYLDALAPLATLTLPVVPRWAEPVWHLFVVGHDERDRLASDLARFGVATLVHYDPLPHLTPAYRDLGWAPGDLPTAERLASRALSLPLSPHHGDDEIDRVVDALTAAIG